MSLKEFTWLVTGNTGSVNLIVYEHMKYPVKDGCMCLTFFLKIDCREKILLKKPCNSPKKIVSTCQFDIWGEKR
jgi:hypothetical protein